MKFFAAIAFLISFSQAHAAEIKISHFPLSDVNSYRSEVDTSFFMNTKTKEGFVDINVFEDKSYPYWGYWSSGPLPEPVVLVHTKRVRVPNLKLEGDQVIYQSLNEKSVCGYLGRGRIFKRPKIFLTGKCNISSQINGNDDRSVIEVTLNVI